MPRYKGPARGLKHRVETLLDDDGIAHLDASCGALQVPRAEALRQAVEVQFVTIFSSKPTGATIQPSDTQGSAS